MSDLQQSMAQGASTVCRLWRVIRKDGLRLGFSDHDVDLTHEGLVYRAQSGLTAGALQMSTGLAVDNSEALGALQDDAISEADLAAGRYDGAEVVAMLLNWADPRQSEVLFRGHLGEVSHQSGAFRAELRGLADVLNQPRGRVYTRDCAAVLGDDKCRFDPASEGYQLGLARAQMSGDGRIFTFAPFAGFQPRWFEGGRFVVTSGPAKGLSGMIKSDRSLEGQRKIELWQALSLAPDLGDGITLYAGCDKRAETCRLKFGNFGNFRGFPHLPDRDWLTQAPQ